MSPFLPLWCRGCSYSGTIPKIQFMEQFSGFRLGFSKIMISIFSIVTSPVLLDCDVFWSPRLWCFPIFKIFIFDLADRNVLQRMVLSLLLQRLQACWSNGDHDIQVKRMVMIMNAIMIHRWACRCFSSVIVFHIEPRMLAQDLMRFGIIYFIFLMGFGQVSFFFFFSD